MLSIKSYGVLALISVKLHYSSPSNQDPKHHFAHIPTHTHTHTYTELTINPSMKRNNII